MDLLDGGGCDLTQDRAWRPRARRTRRGIVPPRHIPPALVALALTERAEGHAATRALLRQVFQWRVGARWYVFAVGYIPAIKLSVALVYRVATGTWPRFGQEPWYLMAAAIVFSTWVQAGEEIGWRGYALPRLSDRFGLAPASVILGIIWASWHLPLFFAKLVKRMKSQGHTLVSCGERPEVTYHSRRRWEDAAHACEKAHADPERLAELRLV